MYELRLNTSSRLSSTITDSTSTFNHLELTRMKKGTSLDQILKEITNFGGLEAETQASLNGLMGWERIAGRTTSTETLTKEKVKKHPFSLRRFYGDKFKDVLVNENLIIVEKEKQRDNTEQDKIEVEGQTEKLNASEGNDQLDELPIPNTVRRYKDIFETLSNKPISCEDKKIIRNKSTVSRSISMRVTSADWKQTKPEYRDIIEKLEGLSVDNEDRRRTLPGRLVIPDKSPCSEIEEARDWLNACSPVSPDVIQKLRQHGTSVTFFGRQLFSPSVSPTQDGSDSDWSVRKPRIIGTTPKNNTLALSLSSSSTCSDEELHFISSFDYPSTESDYLRTTCDQQMDDDSGHDEDSYTYDVVYLDQTYSRTTTPQLGFLHKGVWLRDPFWTGSSYIVYDFRGTNVKPHIRVDTR